MQRGQKRIAGFMEAEPRVSAQEMSDSIAHCKSTKNAFVLAVKVDTAEVWKEQFIAPDCNKGGHGIYGVAELLRSVGFSSRTARYAAALRADA